MGFFFSLGGGGGSRQEQGGAAVSAAALFKNTLWVAGGSRGEIMTVPADTVSA